MARPHESRGAHNQIDCSTRLSDLLFFPIDRPFRRSDQTQIHCCTGVHPLERRRDRPYSITRSA
jgi:hypothetical protein